MGGEDYLQSGKKDKEWDGADPESGGDMDVHSPFA
jgi:hypothetical protein